MQTVDSVTIPRIMLDMLVAYLPTEVRSNLVAAGLNSIHGGVESLTNFFKAADPRAITKVVESAGATIASPKPRRARAAKPKAAKPVTAKPAAAPKAPKGKSGAKRDPQALADLTERLRQRIVSLPGARIEVIAKDLGIATKELSLPIRKLLASGAITKQKEKRATEYYGPKASKKTANGLAATAAE